MIPFRSEGRLVKPVTFCIFFYFTFHHLKKSGSLKAVSLFHCFTADRINKLIPVLGHTSCIELGHRRDNVYLPMSLENM